MPPIDEQRRILTQIDTVATNVQAAKRLRREADVELRSLMVALAHRADLDDQAKLSIGWKKRLSQVLRLSVDVHEVMTDTKYPNLGIYSFARGLFHKPPIDGALTSAKKLQRVRRDQFIYSRLFAFEGAFGMVTSEFDGVYVSNEYPTFDCDLAVIRPEFLVAYTMSQRVWKDFAKSSKGLGDRRQRLKPEQLLAQEVWLPPLHWQKAIVEVYQQTNATQRSREQVSQELDALVPSLSDQAFAAASPVKSGRGRAERGHATCHGESE